MPSAMTSGVSHGNSPKSNKFLAARGPSASLYRVIDEARQAARHRPIQSLDASITTDASASATDSRVELLEQCMSRLSCEDWELLLLSTHGIWIARQLPIGRIPPRRRCAELAGILAGVMGNPASEISAELIDPAKPWITFWQEIGRLIRVEQHLTEFTLLAMPDYA